MQNEEEDETRSRGGELQGQGSEASGGDRGGQHRVTVYGIGTYLSRD